MAKLWTTWFDRPTLSRGQDYADRGAVSKLTHNDRSISAEVDGSEPYEVEIQLGQPQWIAGQFQVSELSSECTCPVGDACKHAAAALFVYEERLKKSPASVGKPKSAAKKKSPVPPLPVEEQAPDEHYERIPAAVGDDAVIQLLVGGQADPAPARSAKSSAQSLLYVLDRVGIARVRVTPATGRRLKDGTWRDVKRKADVPELLLRAPAYMTDEDRAIVARLIAEGRRDGYGPYLIELIGSRRSGEQIGRAHV